MAQYDDRWLIGTKLVIWSTVMRFAFDRKLVVIAWAGFLTGSWSIFISPSPCNAHHPDYENKPVRLHFEPIPPWLNNITSFRERYNRPRYFAGKLLYHIEPTSQEAMSWHRSVHRGYYADHAPRMEDRYIYPKPWQMLTVGPRTPVGSAAGTDHGMLPSPSDTSDVNSNDEVDANPPTEPSVELLPMPKL